MSVGKILLLLVNLKYLIILIIYFHLQNLCSSKSVSRHLLIIILIFFFRGVASWGERAGGWDQSSLTISVRKFPWKAIPGFHTLVHRRDSLECRCVGMHREGWDGLGCHFPGRVLPFPKEFQGCGLGMSWVLFLDLGVKQVLIYTDTSPPGITPKNPGECSL